MSVERDFNLRSTTIVNQERTAGLGVSQKSNFLIYYGHLSTIFITKTGDVLKLHVRIQADVAKKHVKAMQSLSPLLVLSDGRGFKEII